LNVKLTINNFTSNITMEAVGKDTDSLGLSAMKIEQMQRILSLLEKRDVLGVLPTGYGKSKIYSLLPLVRENSLIDKFCK